MIERFKERVAVGAREALLGVELERLEDAVKFLWLDRPAAVLIHPKEELDRSRGRGAQPVEHHAAHVIPPIHPPLTFSCVRVEETLELIGSRRLRLLHRLDELDKVLKIDVIVAFVHQL